MTTDNELRAYLLGTLPEADSEELEANMLDDEDLFLTVRSVEDDLFDDYVRNRLSAPEREGFSRRYEKGQARIAFAGALARRRANVVPFRRYRWIGLAAAAAVVIAFGSMFLNRQVTVVPAEKTHLVTRTPIRNVTPATSVAVTLTLGGSRSATQTPSVVIPAGAATLQLRVRLNPADRFDRYSMELRAPGKVVWQTSDLLSAAEGGELFLLGFVPASSLDDGSYELAVRGLNGSAQPEDLGFQTLEVHRAR